MRRYKYCKCLKCGWVSVSLKKPIKCSQCLRRRIRVIKTVVF